MTTPEQDKWKFWTSIIAPPLIALVIGFGSSWLTVQVMLNEHAQRIEKVEKATAKMEAAIKEADRERGNTRERLAAIEAKIDIVLMKVSLSNDYPQKLQPSRQR